MPATIVEEVTLVAEDFERWLVKRGAVKDKALALKTNLNAFVSEVLPKVLESPGLVSIMCQKSKFGHVIIWLYINWDGLIALEQSRLKNQIRDLSHTELSKRNQYSDVSFTCLFVATKNDISANFVGFDCLMKEQARISRMHYCGCITVQPAGS